jgi:transposase InsO family protein
MVGATLSRTVPCTFERSDAGPPMDLFMGPSPSPDACDKHESAPGSQYTSVAFGKRCREAGVRPTMDPRGDTDDALCESSFATLGSELTYAVVSRPRPRSGYSTSSSSKGGTTPVGATPALTTSLPWSKKGGTWPRLPEESLRRPRKRRNSDSSFDMDWTQKWAQVTG